MPLAPIVLFVYNRPRHTEQTLNALAANDLADQSILFIYADGPKAGASAEVLGNIQKTRSLIKAKKWCKEVHILESDVNKGLADSVIKGVTEVINKYEKVIVLEDDIVTSTSFLNYMNDSLNTYVDEQKVLSIGAFNFFATDKNVSDTFFIPIPDCWGWATWKNKWQLFESNPQKLLNKLRENNLIDKFNLGGAYNFENMLIDQIKGNINSWAIRWQAVAYLNNMLTLYPKYSVTKNIGFDADGTHSSSNDRYSKQTKFATTRIKVEKIVVAEDPSTIKQMTVGFARTTKPAIGQKIKADIKKLAGHFLPASAKAYYFKIKSSTKDSGWYGDYSSWQQAKQDSGGYDDSIILEKTKKAILKLKNGEAAFERDSVLFDKPEFNWPVLTILLKAAAENDKKLSVLDFGGALGSAYFQNRELLQSVSVLEWSIIEQPHYINTGNKFVADESLKFYSDVASCLRERKPNVLLLSGVLQYVELPYALIDQLINYDFNYIIIDRTAFINAKERLTVQKVPADIYPASYPAWFFDKAKFLDAFKIKYNRLADFEPYPGLVISLDKANGYYKGFIFKKINNEY